MSQSPVASQRLQVSPHCSTEYEQATSWRPPYASQFGSPPQRRSPRTRAPHAGRMTSFRQVSWLAGRRPSPPSQTLRGKVQWHVEKGSPPTVAGAAPDLPRPLKRRGAPDTPLADQRDRRT